MNPEDINPSFKSICYSFPIDFLLKNCKLLNVRPQSILSIAELYSILNTLSINSECNAFNQVTINLRKQLNLSETIPFSPTSVIYILNNIIKNTIIKDLIIEFQKKT